MARSCDERRSRQRARARSPPAGSGSPSSAGSAWATAMPVDVDDRGVGDVLGVEARLENRPQARVARAARRTDRAPAPTTSRARWKIALASSSARAWLSSRLTRASRARCSRLSTTTTTAPTIDVTPRTCLPLMPRRMSGSGSGLGLQSPEPSSGLASLGLLRSQPQLVQLVVQRLQADAENLGRARLVVARVLERHQDQPPLGLLDRRARRQRDLRLRLGAAARRSATGGRCCGSMNGPGARIVARSMTLRSSRTLPGQCVAARACASPRGRRRRSTCWLRALNSLMNAWTSSGRSSLRSRSGGSCDREDVQPVVQVLAQLALLHRLGRIDVGRGDDAHVDRSAPARPPRRRNVRSCSTRSSFTCVAGVISAISSRNSVPRSASSKQPWRRSAAPVNAPFSWPKISLSSSVSGIAAQLIATNGNGGARAQLVDRLRDQLLAGARLAGDEHRRAASAPPARSTW